jgi:hypothetical protein
VSTGQDIATARRVNGPSLLLLTSINAAYNCGGREIILWRAFDLLKKLSFGVQVAEDEVNEIASYFVETNQWARVAKGDIDIIRGEKGAGKSAIYSLLMTKTGTFFDQGILLVAAENPRGGTVFKDLVANPPTSENEFIVLWKLYVLTIVAQQLREYDIRGAKAEKLYAALEGAKLLEREFSLRGVLRSVHEYARRIVAAEALEGGLTIDPITQMPSGITGKIVLKEPSSDLKKSGFSSIDNLFTVLNELLEENKLHVWVLLDRLDVAFVEKPRTGGKCAARSNQGIRGRSQSWPYLSEDFFAGRHLEANYRTRTARSQSFG